MNQIEQIIAVAERYVGIRETPPNSNNVIFNTRYYGHPVSGPDRAWCCAFDWCLFQDIGAPELFYGGKQTASCTTLMNWAKSVGQFHTSGFRRGDLALFDFDGNRTNAEHVGIIKAVLDSTVVTIEGNTGIGNDANGGMVMERVRNNNLIIGVFRPAYAEDKKETEEEDMPSKEEYFKIIDEYFAEKAKKDESAWSDKEGYWDMATAAGIVDGTSPQAPITREQSVAILGRLGLIE